MSKEELEKRVDNAFKKPLLFPASDEDIKFLEELNQKIDNTVFIKGSVPALKNGKIWTGRFLVYSKRVKEYLKSHNIKSFNSSERGDKKKEVIHFKNGINTFEIEAIKIKDILSTLEPPYKFQFHFVRNTKHKFDFGNGVELLADLFTSYGVIADDNMDIFHPSILYIDGKGYKYDKENPGVLINILKE